MYIYIYMLIKDPLTTISIFFFVEIFFGMYVFIPLSCLTIFKRAVKLAAGAGQLGSAGSRRRTRDRQAPSCCAAQHVTARPARRRLGALASAALYGVKEPESIIQDSETRIQNIIDI